MAQSPEGVEPPYSTRRSTRNRKTVQKYGASDELPSPGSQQKPAQLGGAKRKVQSKPTYEQISPLLEKTIAAVTPEEKDTFLGWVAIESEPAFFEAMMKRLGAQDLTIREAFSLDDLSTLPHPIHGLVLLLPAQNETVDDNEYSSSAGEDSRDSLWFANQTTKNGCGTVALLNVLMNIEGGCFDERLAQFLATTKSEAPPLRGHVLATNDWIRGIHNSVARRIDLLEEELTLDVEYEDADIVERQAKPKRAPRNAKIGRKKMKKAVNSNASTLYHYIAYVPKDGLVWELDGLEFSARCIGPITLENWIETATSRITDLMARDQSHEFNLMAICESSLSALKMSLASNLGNAMKLDQLWRSGHGVSFHEEPDAARTAERLEHLGIDAKTIQSTAHATPDFCAKLEELCPTKTDIEITAQPETTQQLAGSGNSQARDHNQGEHDRAAATIPDEMRTAVKSLYDSLAEERFSLLDTIEREIGLDSVRNIQQDGLCDKLEARHRDFTPAVFEWARTLAEKGLLRDLMTED